jgi:DNA recombination protein RmuC
MIYSVVIFLFLLLAFFVFLSSTKKQMKEEFKALTLDINQKNEQSFLSWIQAFLANNQNDVQKQLENKKKEIDLLLMPVKENLLLMQEYFKSIEKDRQIAYGGLVKQLEGISQAEAGLLKQTHDLSLALKSPNIRGSWGQIHLRRIIEMSGLTNHCDFDEQVSTKDDQGAYRPDLVIHLPGNKQIILDAKTPFEAYAEAVKIDNDQEKKKKLEEHATALRKYIKDLSSKNYNHQIALSFDYIILFLPIESLFIAALEVDPNLLEMAASYNIILATPTSLMAILRAIAMTWRHENLSKNAYEIAEIGKDLHERMLVMMNHFSKLGKSLNSAIETYNQTVSSLETRVLVSAKKLQELGATLDQKEYSVEKIEKILKERPEKVTE